MPAPVKKKRRSMLWNYLFVALAVFAGVALFSLLYRGGGAQALLALAPASDAASRAATPTSLSAAAPSPTLQAEPISTEGRLFAYQADGMWGYQNAQGQVVITPQFAQAQDFTDTRYAFAAIQQEGVVLYGLLSRTGGWVVEPCWSGVSAFSDGYAAVEQDGKWGYIAEDGTLAVPYAYREAYGFCCGRAKVRPGSNWGYIDTDGDLAIRDKWAQATDFGNDMAFVQEDGKWYVIDKAGEKITTLGTSSAGGYYNGYAAVVNQEGSYDYLNTQRKVAFRNSYEAAGPFSSDGLAPVKSDGKWGYLNTQGVLAIAPAYEDAGPFSQGRAAVQNESGKWGYVDSAGAVIADFLYDAAQPFLSDYARVQLEGQEGFLDRDGKFTLLTSPPQ